MLSHSVAIRFSRAWERFRRAEDANIAVIFAIVLVPLLGFVGAAVDYSRASNARTAMQAAADSAALMVSKDLSSGAITSSQIESKAQAYFSALYTNTDASQIAISATYTARDSNGSSSVVVTGTGTMPTTFMKVAGFPSMGLRTGSTAKWGGTRMRVAIALDVTGSMASEGKMAAMQTAAKSLIDTLSNMAKTADDVYVSIVPFAQFVNVGKANKDADWLKWTEFGKCSFYTNKADNDTNAYYNAYVSRFASDDSCANFSVSGYRATWTALSNKNAWNGCVIDRDQNFDTTRDAPTSSAKDYPAAYSVQYSTNQNSSDICPAQILPMTSIFTSKGTDTSNDTSTIKGKINSLVPNGATNQAIGMAWAWQTLSPDAPFASPPKDANYQYTDVIILLSDGLNTIDRWYGDGSNPASQVDARQKLLCDNIKTPATTGAKVPQMFTIQVNTDGDPESAVLKYCADNGNFYPASTAAGIAGAFDKIGVQLSKLRVAF